MRIRVKIVGLGVVLCAIIATTVIVLLLINQFQLRRHVAALGDDLRKLSIATVTQMDDMMQGDLDKMARNIQLACKSSMERTDLRLTHNLSCAQRAFAAMGGLREDETKPVFWKYADRSGQLREIKLPQLIAGDKWLGQNGQLAVESPVVDVVREYTRDPCTVYQRMNDRGDMIAVCTSFTVDGKTRALGMTMQAEVSGQSDPIIKSILAGEIYFGKVELFGKFYIAKFAPLLNSGGKVIGMLSVVVDMSVITTDVYELARNVRIGGSGYVWVIYGHGDRRGVYVLSKNGIRDGENIWDSQDKEGRYFIREAAEKALAVPEGNTGYVHYLWQNVGEDNPRLKFARVCYYQPWDWVIGASAYDDEYKLQVELVDVFRDSVVTMANDAERGLQVTMIWTCVATVSMIILALIAGWLITTSITRPLIAARIAAEEAGRSKSVFLANMSHEIRTPLNAIIGYAAIMEMDPRLSATNRQSLGVIHRSGMHLLSLINDVLEMARLEYGGFSNNIVAFDLRLLLDELATMFRLRAEQKGIGLDIKIEDNVPQYIFADERKVRQIVINMLGNSVKFTPAGWIRVSVRASDCVVSAGDSPKFRISVDVEDTGAGISAEEKEKVFAAFEQTQSGRGSGSGTGLGMAISRQFARNMDGDLEIVRSEVGRGSLFRFSFCAATAGADEVKAPVVRGNRRKIVSIRSGQKKWSALIVDDDATNRDVLSRMLEQYGFRVNQACGGNQAIDVVKLARPDVVLMDIRMPDMDGFEATRRIKALGGKPPVAVIIVTASVLAEHEKTAFDAGADGFVRKPYFCQDILEKIAGVVDVEYDYEDVCSVERQVEPPSRKTVEKIPAEFIGQLKDAVEMGDVTAIENAINEIRKVDGPAADGLASLAARYEFDKLLALLKDAADVQEGDRNG